MLFHTPRFVLFLAAFLVCYLPVRRSAWGVRVIVLFSSLFYASWDWRFLPLLWVTIFVDYVIARRMRVSTPSTEAATVRLRSARKRLLIASIACNLGILFYFKYWNFVVSSLFGTSAIGTRLAKPELILPLGISFYIFQSMSYIIDVYRGRQEPLDHLRDFAAFVTFFPHLVAGPIQRIQQLVPQILKPADLTVSRVVSGALLFGAGFLRKSCGDILAGFHDPIFKSPASADPAAMTISLFTFGLQIYLDFAGYSEMAVGLARCLGIDLMDNFKAPYLSTSIQEFWRRWHISLSFWLRDYLYISLGGNRSGWLLQARNLVFTMTVCGLWHGAGWNYVMWGLLHGVLMVLNSAYHRLIGPAKRAHTIRRPVSGLLGWVVTYVLANYFWLYFRIPSWPQAMEANRKVLAWLEHPVLPTLPPGALYIAAAVLVSDLYIKWKDELVSVHVTVTPPRAIAYGAVTGLLFTAAIILSVGSPTVQFIYFQF